MNEPVELGETRRYLARYTEEEQDRLAALAYAWRVNLAHSVEEAGCASVEEYVNLYRRAS